MKNKHLNFKDLKLESFVTSVNTHELYGGNFQLTSPLRSVNDPSDDGAGNCTR